MTRALAAPLHDALTLLHARWGFYRAYYGLATLPAHPPPKRLLRRRATAQARADAARGYRVLPAVTV